MTYFHDADVPRGRFESAHVGRLSTLHVHAVLDELTPMQSRIIPHPGSRTRAVPSCARGLQDARRRAGQQVALEPLRRRFPAWPGRLPALGFDARLLPFSG